MVYREDIRVPYIVVIHTNSYSGNFEREMAGYIAGIWDGSTHGGKQANIFAEETEGLADEYQGLPDMAGTVPRENGYGGVPVSIWATPGRLNNGFGFHYDDADGDEQEARRRAVEAIEAYHAPQIKRYSDRLASQDFEPEGWTKEACEQALQSSLDAIARIADGPLGKYPAYESVAIFFDSEPNEKQLDLMWERAKKFCDPNSATAEFHRTENLEVKSLELIRWERKIEITETPITKRES